MITTRLVVVSLVVGVVLAVGSVVVCAGSWQLRGVRFVEADLLGEWHGHGHTMLVTRYDDAGVTHWDVVSSPDPNQALLSAGTAEPRMRQVDRERLPASVRTPLDGQFHGRSSHRTGWPLRAAEDTGRWDPVAARTVQRGALTIRAFGRDLTIPYVPLWPGLLGNTLFYAALVLTPLALLRWRTLRRRARRGLCQACGYELGKGVDACPECGLARRGRPTSKPFERARPQEGVDMSLSELERILQQEGFNPDIYSLSGGNANDTLCLAQEDGRWCVYYTERGAYFDKRWFDAEGEACEYFLSQLRSLPRWQTHLSDGPRDSS